MFITCEDSDKHFFVVSGSTRKIVVIISMGHNPTARISCHLIVESEWEKLDVSLEDLTNYSLAEEQTRY